MKPNNIRTFFAVLLFTLSALCFAVDGIAGPFRISLSTDPVMVPVGKAKVQLKVSDSQGKPVSGATVKVFARMPNMNMGEREEVAMQGSEPGSYTAPATFAMAGQYDVTVSVSAASGSGQTVLQVSTGQSSASGSGSNSIWLFGLAVLVILAPIAWRMVSTGQKISLRGLFSKTVLLSLGLLAIAFAAGTWAVRNLRREGSMTPLEAQVMEMNTPAPEGALPVTVAEVKSEPFAASVTYSGQVLGFVEQDVVPRVSGTIVGMPVYVGDKVKRGQLLAKLDTSQIDPMIAEKAAGVNNASQGVGVADAEYQQALNMVEQSRAEAKMAETEISEARSMLESAKASRSSSASAVEAANSEVRSAQSEVDAAKADQTYQSQELERMRQLFAKGAVSKDEWQQAVATAQKTGAALASANEKLAKAGSMASGARSDLKRSDADVSAATSRVAKAEANYRAKLTQVKTALSGVQSARSKVGQSRAAVSEASAGLKGASTQKGYSELRAQVDGVVTQRLVSPGVVVAPGQSVLKVAQVSPVRIQANVPQQDLSKIKVGDEVQVLGTPQSGPALKLKVSSVSPAVDPSSRMGVVEAVYSNQDHHFSPGQFVSLAISVGSSSYALVIPSDALVTDSHNGETAQKVWVVAASSPGRLAVSLRQVGLQGLAHGKAAVRTGLKQGERVVVAPFGLAEGMQVQVSAEPATVKGDTITIELTGAGYSPDVVQIPAGKPTKLSFVRKVQDTCATAVDFPEIGLHAETPLNKPTTVEIPAQPAGKELSFTCPMNMYKGKAVVK